MFNHRVRLFVVLACLFVTSLVVGDIIGGKLLEVHVFGWPMTISVGMIPFPVTFVLTDLLNEFYGKQPARFVTLIGFCMAAFTLALIFGAVSLPWAPFTRGASWTGVRQEHFDNIFAGSQRLLIASLAAYLASQFTDIAIFQWLKKKSNNRHLWLRATGSTLVSQLIDTCAIQVLAWAGILTFSQIVSIVLTAYVFKVFIAIALTPVIYFGHSLVEKQLGLKPIRLDDFGEPIPE